MFYTYPNNQERGGHTVKQHMPKEARRQQCTRLGLCGCERSFNDILVDNRAKCVREIRAARSNYHEQDKHRLDDVFCREQDKQRHVQQQKRGYYARESHRCISIIGADRVPEGPVCENENVENGEKAQRPAGNCGTKFLHDTRFRTL